MSIAQNKNMVLTERGLAPSALSSITDKLAKSHAFETWAGHRAVSYYESISEEYFAIRNSIGMIDVSLLHKYLISGKDALDYVNRLVTRDIRKIKHNRVAYCLWCDEEGMVIDDGTIFHLAGDQFMLTCQESQWSWLLDLREGFDITIEDITHNVATIAIQGPAAYHLLKRLSDTKLEGFEIPDVKNMKPFDCIEWKGDTTARFTKSGKIALMISRTGFTGDLGYELWCHRDLIETLWHSLLAVGKNLRIQPAGQIALGLARIEAGFIATNLDFMSSHIASRHGRGRTPFELLMGKLVHFDKPYFNGKEALWRLSGGGDKKIIKKNLRFLLQPIDIACKKEAKGSIVYYKEKIECGHITSSLWSPTLKRNVGYAELKAPYGIFKTQHLFAEVWTNKENMFEKVMAPLDLCERPFFNPPRKTQTPPGLV
ncbi:MAG: aminomethyltransferase family protein [Alphaproteobacteria bacterium]